MPDKERHNRLLNDSMDQYDDIEPEQIKRFFDATLVETFNDPQRDEKSPETFIPPEADTKVEVISKNGSKNVESKEEPCSDLPDSGEGVPPRTGKNTRTKYRTRGAVRQEAKPTAKPSHSTSRHATISTYEKRSQQDSLFSNILVRRLTSLIFALSP